MSEPSEQGVEDGEAAAWAEVQARWGEPAVHTAYLARFADLDGLARAGRRYRDRLAERPDDTVALAMKGEILKRATVVGLALLPRTAPPDPGTRNLRRWVMRVMATWIAVGLAYVVWKLLGEAGR